MALDPNDFHGSEMHPQLLEKNKSTKKLMKMLNHLDRSIKQLTRAKTKQLLAQEIEDEKEQDKFLENTLYDFEDILTEHNVKFYTGPLYNLEHSNIYHCTVQKENIIVKFFYGYKVFYENWVPVEFIVYPVYATSSMVIDEDTGKQLFEGCIIERYYH